ncbi:bifunctional adenosylcobinamide kinase/adenosylcobinamide-phosphate guanylyltransferase [Vibrio sp. Y2-5]|uniref:bifunctional adenosylcobinamide kinase/adenosylcobinamide-phosphate guanylyltransferase n=1 Tax=Vibrio sp. Y2-5 TaxID=2743977 RepID=UPI0016610305|nr:bifunctional adenosylcobinamide kinase/adenosylcobinamide-phosphate guanylyltransferase [Vibrio sp. Y2-5]MBD0785562.1 bifunctional adenosylcobinamide kinase/adenosylcobinamide-phosphate guanylyltransferase [Vibrio sp. Y2-5]
MAVRLYLGGARSGNTSFAEQQAMTLLNQGNGIHPYTKLHYVATVEAFDQEMKARISLRQARRDEQWNHHECPLELAKILMSFNEQDIVLVDCLAVWLNNLIHCLGDNADSEQIKLKLDELTQALAETHATILCVSTEVGLGIVPKNALSRLYVDHCGWMNQAVAKVAEQVDFVVAGLPMNLKRFQ